MCKNIMHMQSVMQIYSLQNCYRINYIANVHYSYSRKLPNTFITTVYACLNQIVYRQLNTYLIWPLHAVVSIPSLARDCLGWSEDA